MSSLDPRSPFALDTRELGRRPGSMKTYKFSVAAPADVGLAMIAVPAGSDIELDIRLEAVMDGVLVTGTALVSVNGECSRCLEQIAFDLEVDLQELFEYSTTDTRGRQVKNPETEDDLPKLDGDFLDLEPVLRDAVVLAFPLSPLCFADCRGLCSECGANFNEDPEHMHETVDPRWAALAELAKDNEAK